MDYTVHGMLQARILERVAFPFSRGSSQPRDQTQVSHIAAGFSPAEPQGKPKNTGVNSLPLLQWSSRPRNQTRVSFIAGRFFTNWAIREAPGPPAKSPSQDIFILPQLPPHPNTPTWAMHSCVHAHTHIHTNIWWYLIKSMPTMKASLYKILSYFLMFSWLMVRLRSTIFFYFSIYSFH